MIDCPVCGRDVSLQEYSYNDEMCVHCLKKVYEEEDQQEIDEKNENV